MNGEVRLEEARQYFVSPGPGDTRNVTALLGPLALEWDPAERAFRLPVSQWVGAQLLRVVNDASEWTAPIQVVPRADKVSEHAWATLLSDLEEWLPALS
ncbi:MAG: hypothetical protein L0Y66_27820, partial [Myxococcaceae bacterium]|nr:hypothetical protein [Myxococcaceae bacterium]